MGKVARFLENELDRVSEYLAMAKANLVVAAELCEDRCKKITSELTEKDEKIIEYLDKQLSLLDSKICDSRDIINDFKNYSFGLED